MELCKDIIVIAHYSPALTSAIFGVLDLHILAFFSEHRRLFSSSGSLLGDGVLPGSVPYEQEQIGCSEAALGGTYLQHPQLCELGESLRPSLSIVEEKPVARSGSCLLK